MADWAAVYRTTYRELVRYLYRRVWDDERAQDLAQEAFVRSLDADPDDPRAWLFRVASNLAKDEARLVVRRKRHLALLKSDAEARSPAPDPHVGVERKERSARVRAALETLGERDREALLLWDAGFDYAEIAEQTGLSKGAVGTTLARARRRLADAFNDGGWRLEAGGRGDEGQGSGTGGE